MLDCAVTHTEAGSLLPHNRLLEFFLKWHYKGPKAGITSIYWYISHVHKIPPLLGAFTTVSLEKWPVILPSQHSSANLVALKEQLKCGAPAACHQWNLLKFAFEAGGALQWLSGMADIGHFSSQVTQFRLSQTHLPWPKCNKYTLQAQRCGCD